MKRILAIALVVLVGASVALAQESVTTEGLKQSKLPSGGIDFRNAKNVFRGLLDSKRFSMSHTVGMSFGAGGSSGTNQYYVNTMTYQFTPNLTGVAQVGVQHARNGASAFGASGSRTRVMVPNLGLLYTPRPNMRIELQMSQTPSGYGYYGPYGHFYDPSIGR